MQATRDNLRQHAARPLTQWLIHAAKRRSSLTYGEAKRRLETEIDFNTIFSSMMGVPAGALMNRILRVRSDCPLLNILLVRQGDGMPGDGAGTFMADYLGRPQAGKGRLPRQAPASMARRLRRDRDRRLCLRRVGPSLP